MATERISEAEWRRVSRIWRAEGPDGPDGERIPAFWGKGRPDWEWLGPYGSRRECVRDLVLAECRMTGATRVPVSIVWGHAEEPETLPAEAWIVSLDNASDAARVAKIAMGWIRTAHLCGDGQNGRGFASAADTGRA